MTRTVFGATALARSSERDRQKTTRSAAGAADPWRAALPRRHIPRPWLWATLDLALNKRLTVLGAPAGAGKTVLLAQWAQRRCAGLDLQWFSISDRDNDVAHLRSRLRALTSDTRVVIIDDVHVLHAEQAVAALADYIHSIPCAVHWIVSGRGVPNFRSSELAIRDELLCVDAARLRVDAAFIQRFAQSCGDVVALERALQIFEQTEGWLAGVKLALLPQDEKPNVAAGFADAYFANLVHSLPQSFRVALLLYSVPDTITSTLAAALAKEFPDDQIAPFHRLEETHLFLIRTGLESDEYRFNRQFHAYLRATARATRSSQLPQWHRVASRWFFDRKRYKEALQHAEGADDTEWRLEVLASALPHFLRTGAIETALQWSGRIERSELFMRDSVWTAHIAALILARRFYAASQALDLARARMQVATYCKATNEKLVTLQLMLDLLSGHAQDIEVDRELYGEHYLTGTLLSLRAYTLFQNRQFDAARRCAHQAREKLLGHGSPYGATHANAVLCAALSRLARYEEGRDECERMFGLFSEGMRDASWANAALALAHVRYEQNQLTEADTLCNDALPLLSNAASVHCYAASRFLMARIRSATGRSAEGWRILDDLHGYLDSCKARHLLAQLASEKMIYAAHHAPESMARIAEDFALDKVELRWIEVESTAPNKNSDLALLGYAQALRLVQLAAFDRALTLIRALIDDAQRHADMHRLVILEGLQAAVYKQLGDDSAVRDALSRALTHTRDAGFTRGVFDEVPQLACVFVEALRNGHVGTMPRKYLERYARLLGINSSTRSGSTRASNVYSIESLTEREADILKLLASGMSNQEICAHTHIAITTTKWHLKNIFAKLSVRTRTAALVRARALQLID